MAHDFKAFPELANHQVELYYFDSPHKQIFEDFTAKVMKVTDGDTIRVQWSERDFDFPVRFINIAAPERKETGGPESRNWLESQVLGELVDIKITPSLRVGKWGRILGYVHLKGIDMGEASMMNGHSISWDDRDSGSVGNPIKEFEP